MGWCRAKVQPFTHEGTELCHEGVDFGGWDFRAGNRQRPKIANRMVEIPDSWTNVQCLLRKGLKLLKLWRLAVRFSRKLLRFFFQRTAAKLKLSTSSTSHSSSTIIYINFNQLHLHQARITYMIYIYFNQPHLHHVHHVPQLQWKSSSPHTSSTVTSHNFTKFINNMTHINFIYNTSTLTSHLHRLHPSLTQSTPEAWHKNCDTGLVILDLLQSYTGIVTQEWLHGREFCFHPGIVNFLGDLLVPELLHSSYFPSSSKFYSFGDSQAAAYETWPAAGIVRVGWRALCVDRARRTHKRVVKWEVCLCPQNPHGDRAQTCGEMRLWLLLEQSSAEMVHVGRANVWWHANFLLRRAVPPFHTKWRSNGKIWG